MTKTSFAGAASVLALLVAGCGSGDAPPQNEAESDMNAMMADPNNPFAQSEMAMDQAMTAAVGVNAADSWVRKMIEHHRGAIDMSRIVLTQSPTAEVAKMAQMTIDKQGREVAALEKLVASGTPDPASAELYRPATTQMHDAMMAARGATVSETYLRKMLAHHQGAVAMSDVALANGAAGAVRAQIEKTRADQIKEIAMVEAMLRGEPMQHGGQEAAAPAPAERSASTPKASSPAAPRPAPKPAPKPQPKAPEPACTPEHRALGHC